MSCDLEERRAQIEAQHRAVDNCVLRGAPLSDDIADYAPFKQLWHRALAAAMPHASPSHHDDGIRSPRGLVPPRPRRQYDSLKAASPEQLDYYKETKEMEEQLSGSSRPETATFGSGTPKADSGYDGRSDGESEWSGNIYSQSSLATSSTRCGSSTLAASSASATDIGQATDAVDSDATGVASSGQFIENNVAPPQSTCSLGDCDVQCADSRAKFNMGTAGEESHCGVSTSSANGRSVTNALGALMPGDVPVPPSRVAQVQKNKRRHRRRKTADVGGTPLVFVLRVMRFAAPLLLLFAVLFYWWRSIDYGWPAFRIDARYLDGPPPV